LRISLLLFSLILILFIFVLPLFGQVNLDYVTVVDQDINNWNPFGYGYTNFGPYSILGRVWIFYSDGDYAAWKTKQLTAGGEWSEKGILFPAVSGRLFNVTYDGSHFHIVRYDEMKIFYLRAMPQLDGSLLFDDEVEIFSDPVWKAYDFQQPEVAMISIATDYNRRPWILAQVQRLDTSTSDTLYKSIILSSVDTSGGWINRPGFPRDFQIEYNNRYQGHGPAVVEIENGNILFLSRIVSPVHRMQARLWIEDELNSMAEGTLGSHETINGIDMESTRTSVISPAPGLVMLNTNNTVARRNINGSWTVVTPLGMVTEFYNNLTVADSKVRFWDRSGNSIRYRETSDYGATWGPLTTKWMFDGADLFTSSYSIFNQGEYHSMLWVIGDRYEFPKILMMGIEGAVEPPPVPLLVTPSNGEDNIVTSGILTWSAVEGAVWYHIQVSLVPDFSSTVIDESYISDIKYIYSGLLNDTEYYWRLRSVGGEGIESMWSDVWSFKTVVYPPEKPYLVSPLNGSVGVDLEAAVEWGAAERAEWYMLQLASDEGFSNLVVNVDNLEQTTYTVDNLLKETIYYWRVRAYNLGGESEWSSVWHFETVYDIPEIPHLASPENGSNNLLATVNLEWLTAERATSYQAQLSKFSDFSNIIYDTSNVSTTTLTIDNLDYESMYFWRIRGENSFGVSEWSSVWSFTTAIQPPDVPLLAYPKDGSLNISVDTLLIWEHAARAHLYHVQLSNDPDFNDITIDSVDIDNLYLSVIGLDSNTTYYWRVLAVNEGGKSEWSTVWSFTTVRTTVVDDIEINVPMHYSLSQNFPNPFNPTTTIQYSIPSDGKVRLVVYNMVGQVIVELVNEYQSAGIYEVILEANNIPSGAYIYHFTAGHYVATKRMLIVK
jgi:hypothetical protein